MDAESGDDDKDGLTSEWRGEYGTVSLYLVLKLIVIQW